MSKKIIKEDIDTSISALIDKEIRKNFQKFLKKIFTLNLLTFLIVFFMVLVKAFMIDSKVKDIKELAKRSFEKVIIATPDGRIVEVSKKEISEEVIKEYIKEKLKLLFYDGYFLTDGFDKSYSSIKDFVIFLKEKGVIKNLKEIMDKKELNRFIKLYFLLLPNIPDVVKVKDIEIESIKKDEGGKVLKAKVKALIGYIDEKGETKLRQAEGTLVVRFIINPFIGTPNNPYGFKILKIVSFPLFMKGE